LPEISFEELYTQGKILFNPEEPEQSILVIREKLGTYPEYHKFRIEEMLLGHDANKAHSVPKENGPWYSPKEGHEYWNSYFSLTEKKTKQWVKEEKDALGILQSLDINTTKIVNHLFNPQLQGDQSRYGLVIGHVQSGKTANYTGLIAKAADCGYNLIVVLTGLYNDLRHQTQVRIEKELTGTFSDAKGFSVDGRNYKIPWRILTRTGPKGDFFNGYPRKNENYHEPLKIEDLSSPTILLMKKNVTPLTRLNEWLASIDANVIENLNVLIVDDESDHASVNTMTGRNEESSHTGEHSENKINGEIRKMLQQFNRFSYVGYTATPFANIFINPDDDGLGLGPTLYPRDFIVSLPRPTGYFGLSTAFSECTEDEEKTPIRIVPNPDAQYLWQVTDDVNAPQTKKLPNSLTDALMDYLLTTAARRVRGENKKHHSMLIHTKYTKKSMHPLSDRINKFLLHWRLHFPKSRTDKGRKLNKQFHDRWLDEFISRGTLETWDEIEDELYSVFNDDDSLEIIELNEDTEDVLDYERNDNEGLRAIVIGGNRLSRGLTLEGLTVSYFIRESTDTNHDTLLQMGRWFGYKGDNTDLVRIYITSRLNSQFSSMILVEESLRTDLELYEKQDEITPADFGIRVLKAFDMFPTSSSKRKGVTTISRDGNMDKTYNYTRQIPFNQPVLLKSNLKAFSEFITSLGTSETIGNKKEHHIWSTNSDSAIRFLQSLEYPECADNTFNITEMISYIQKRCAKSSTELSDWSVLLAGLQEDKKRDIPLKKPLEIYGNNVEIRLPQRSRKIDSHGIGDFTGQQHRIIDLPERNKFIGEDGTVSMSKMWEYRPASKPLIMAYIFDKESKAISSRGRKGSENNTNLFLDEEEKVDVLGICVILPRAPITDEERGQERQYWIRKNSSMFPGLK